MNPASLVPVGTVGISVPTFLVSSLVIVVRSIEFVKFLAGESFLSFLFFNEFSVGLVCSESDSFIVNNHHLLNRSKLDFRRILVVIVRSWG